MIRKVLMGVVIVGVARRDRSCLARGWVQQVTPHPIGTIQTWVDQIWWPVTVLRGGVYVLLAWGRLSPLGTAPYPPGRSRPGRRARDDQPYTDRRVATAAEARWRHLSRARQRSPWVFGAFLVSDLGSLRSFPMGSAA